MLINPSSPYFFVAKFPLKLDEPFLEQKDMFGVISPSLICVLLRII